MLLSQPIAMDSLSLEQQLSQYSLLSLLNDLQKQPHTLPQNIRLIRLPPLTVSSTPSTVQTSLASQSQTATSGTANSVSFLLVYAVCFRLIFQLSQIHHITWFPFYSQKYRSQTGSSTNQSPTSPVSNQGFSPGGSPQVSMTPLRFHSSFDDFL